MTEYKPYQCKKMLETKELFNIAETIITEEKLRVNLLAMNSILITSTSKIRAEYLVKMVRFALLLSSEQAFGCQSILCIYFNVKHCNEVLLTPRLVVSGAHQHFCDAVAVALLLRAAHSAVLGSLSTLFLVQMLRYF